jgi:hypothetical protein
LCEQFFNQLSAGLCLIMGTVCFATHNINISVECEA